MRDRAAVQAREEGNRSKDLDEAAAVFAARMARRQVLGVQGWLAAEGRDGGLDRIRRLQLLAC